MIRGSVPLDLSDGATLSPAAIRAQDGFSGAATPRANRDSNNAMVQGH